MKSFDTEAEMSVIIAKRLEELGMNINQLSRLSGIANSYIMQLIDGRIYRPGRDQLIRIGLGLYWNIHDINILLEQYEQADLSGSDVTYFFEASKKIGFYSGLIPLYSNTLMAEILHLAMERINGDMKLTTCHPPFFLWEELIREQYYLYYSSRNRTENRALADIRAFIIKNRQYFFDNRLHNNQCKHLICEKCFRAFIRERCKSEKFFSSLLYYILDKNYNVKITNICNRIDFQIIEPDDKKEKPVVAFGGKMPGHLMQRPSYLLSGFICNSEEIYELMSVEFSRLEKHAIDECTDKKSTARYILKMLREEGIEMEYDLESISE